MPTHIIIALSVSGAGLVLAVVGLAVQHARGVICGADWCLRRGSDGEAEERPSLRAVEIADDVESDDEEDGEGRCASA
ncbi:hypothetical protein ACI3ET_13305 [Ornithinimicrobium sp. LYQ121]|uniref:hypothetical protein n=1 Tax=Ornithinimicrobium sp. LYQ121 TaxID=3378801 RepID=UPI003852F07D